MKMFNKHNLNNSLIINEICFYLLHLLSNMPVYLKLFIEWTIYYINNAFKMVENSYFMKKAWIFAGKRI